MAAIADIELDRLRPEEIPLAAGLAARAMRDNPMSIALFGDDPVRRIQGLEPMFQWVIDAFVQPPLVVRRHGYLVGLAAMTPIGHCIFRQMAANTTDIGIGDRRISIAIPPIPRHLLLPLLRLGPGPLSRLSAFGEAGALHDPQERHLHVELVVVEGGMQGLGIGSSMLEVLCREMDESDAPGYLETDTEANVRLYRRFGFEVTDEATVVGVPMRYMRREPQSQG